MTASHSSWTRFTAGVRAVISTICSLAVMIGFGWFLVRLSDWPLPDHWPSHAEWDTFLTDPLHGSFLRDLGACTGWLLLLFVVTAVAVEILTRLTRHRFPRLRLRVPAPVRALAAGVVGASIIGLITGPAHAKTDTGGPGQQPPAATALATPATIHPAVAATATITRPGTVTFVIRGQRYHVIVHRGDTMSKIARQWLGDANRWPEICRLNRHRHFATGGTLRDCDLIYPRWDLKLPADAVPPAGAIPVHQANPKPPAVATPPTDPELPPRQPPVAPAIPTPTPSITTPPPVDPDGVVDLETAPPPDNTPTAQGHASPPAAAADSEHAPADSWLTYALAAALVAAATLVIRRRRHARGTRDRSSRNSFARPMPYIASLARHLVHLNDTVQPAPPPPQPDSEDPTTAVPAEPPEDQQPAPAAAAVAGLAGPGAAPAARAAIIATLSPSADAAPGHVITTRSTLETLLEGGAADTTGWPLLHICDTVDDALDELHTQILASRRTHDDPLTADPNPHQTLLVLTPPPANQHASRLQSLLDAAGPSVTVRILGDWPTAHWIAADGTIDGHGPRQPVLTIADTLDALHLIREATAGPPTAPPPSPPTGSEEQPASRPPDPSTPEPAVHPALGTAIADKATLQVLGTVTFGPDRPGTQPHLRSKARELAVYLACRPNGGDVSTICEILYPDSTVTKSLTNVQQAVTSLRKVLTHHTTLRGNPILLSDDRYRLNPDLVDVDLWHLHRHTRAAAATSDPTQRRTHLEHAAGYGAATLAPDLETDWIDAYRVTTTITIVEAHTGLAELIAPTDPERATALLAAAIIADPGNEALYRRRIRLLAQLGQHDAIRATMRDLSRVLTDLDTQPTFETRQLAQRLLGRAGDVAGPDEPVERTDPTTRRPPPSERRPQTSRT